MSAISQNIERKSERKTAWSPGWNVGILEAGIRSLGRLLWEPHHTIADSVERRNVRFLSWLLLVLTVVIVVGTVAAQAARNADVNDYRLADDPLVPIGLSVGMVAGLTYLTSRTRLYRIGLAIDIFYTSVVPIIAAVHGQPGDAPYLMYFEVANILFASFFVRSPKWIAAVALNDVVLVSLYGLYLAPGGFDAAGLSFQIIAIATMIVGGTVHHQRLERERREQLEMVNEALLQTAAESAQAAIRAEESDRLKSEFLATMSHELRTPLNAINGFVSLMLSGMVGEINPAADQLLERVKTNGERLLGLINDVLDISKIEAGRMQLVIREYNLPELVNDVAGQMSSLAVEKNLPFEVSIAPDVPRMVIGDDEQVRKVVINLLSNAFKFTHEGGVYLTVARVDEKRWSVSVRDTGIGIPAYALEYIFHPFRQVDGSSRRKYGGTGLGLSIVHRHVTLMEGRIRLDSVEGKGSLFEIILPVEHGRAPELKLLKEAIGEHVGM